MRKHRCSGTENRLFKFGSEGFTDHAKILQIKRLSFSDSVGKRKEYEARISPRTGVIKGLVFRRCDGAWRCVLQIKIA